MYKISKKIITLGLIATTFIACGNNKEKTETKGIDAIQKEKGIPVNIAKSDTMLVSDIRKYSGGISGYIQKDVYAAVPETITKINARIGQRVSKGKVIVTLDALQGNSPTYRQVKTQAETLEKTYNRMKNVFDNGGISQQSLDEIKAQYDAAKASLSAVTKMNYIESPINGVITKLNVKTGQSAPFGEGAPPMFQVAQIDKVIMTIGVPSHEINFFKKNMPATINMNGEIIKGKITSIPMAANMMTRMFMVEITFPNKSKLLRPGMFVETSIVIKSIEDVAVPIEAIFLKGDKPHIYIIKNRIAKLTPITTVLYGDTHVIISNPNIANHDVVINGINLLSNNSKVEIIKD